MSSTYVNITPWINDRSDEALVFRLISIGFLPGETLQLASWGHEPVTKADVSREAQTLANKALQGLRSLKARDVAKAVAEVGTDIVADNVLHAVGAIPEHESIADRGAVSPPPNVSAPPSKSGFILALTNLRLVFLDVLTCVTHTPSVGEPVRWYAVHRAFPFMRPLSPSLSMRFSWTRVLWERQLDLHLHSNELPPLLRFGSFGIAQAPERARAIAAALGLDPGP